MRRLLILHGVFLSKHRLITDKFKINIISDTPVNEAHVIESIRKEFQQQKDDLGFAVKKLTMKEIALAVIGVVILSLWLYFTSRSDSAIHAEILSIMGWVAIWEATSIAIMQRPEIRLQQKNLDELIKAEIHVSVEEE